MRAVEERFYGRTAETIVFPDHATDGDLPFFADARTEAALEVLEHEQAGGFTLRHARIPAEAANEFVERLMALALEFAHHPRGGDAGVRAAHRRVPHQPPGRAAPKDAP